jgi:hypothetical protein
MRYESGQRLPPPCRRFLRNRAEQMGGSNIRKNHFELQVQGR